MPTSAIGCRLRLKRLHFPDRSLDRLIDRPRRRCRIGGRGAGGLAARRPRRIAEAARRRSPAAPAGRRRRGGAAAVLRVRARPGMGTLPRRGRCCGRGLAVPGGGGVAAMPGGTRFLPLPAIRPGLWSPRWSRSICRLARSAPVRRTGPCTSQMRSTSRCPTGCRIGCRPTAGRSIRPRCPAPTAISIRSRGHPAVPRRASLWHRAARARSLAGPARPADRMVARAEFPAARIGAVAALGQRAFRPRLP